MSLTFLAVSMISEFKSSVSPLLPWTLQCNGSERSFNECTSIATDLSQCEKKAGVICEGEESNMLSINLCTVHTYIKQL